MNKIFKVIWNEARNAYVVVSEIAKNHGSKSCSTKKLLAMLIATGVMTCASFDVLAEKPVAATTNKSQYVAFKDNSLFQPSNGQTKNFDGYEYVYNGDTKYWVREGYVLTINETGGKYTPLSENAIRADVKYAGTSKPEGILQSVTSRVSETDIVTNSGYRLNEVIAGAFAGVSNGGGTEIPGGWNYIIKDSSWNVSGVEFQEGYADLKSDKLIKPSPKGFVTVNSNGKLQWDSDQHVYTYNGEMVNYSNMYVIDGKLGVFTNYGGDKVYTGKVYGKHNEILMTVKDGDKFYSYWGAKVTDPSATMATFPVSEYQENLNVIKKNEEGLLANDIKEVTLDTSKANSATIGLLRNGDKAVDGAITVTSGGGTGGSGAAHDTFVKISNGTTEQTFATGSKVEVKGPKDAITGIKVNGVDYAINNKVYTAGANVNIDEHNVISATDTTYTAGNGIAIDKTNKNAISVKLNKDEKNLVVDGSGLALNTALTGIQSITGADTGAGSISFEGSNVKVNQNTFNSDGRIQGVVAGEDDTDAVNVGQLNKVVAAGDTDVHIKAGEYTVDKDNKVSMNLVDKAGKSQGTVTITGVAKAEDVAVVYDKNKTSLRSTNATLQTSSGKEEAVDSIALGNGASAVKGSVAIGNGASVVEGSNGLGGVALGYKAHAGYKGTSLGSNAISGREGTTLVGANTNSGSLYTTVVGTDSVINSDGTTYKVSFMGIKKELNVQGATATVVGSKNTVDNKNGKVYSGVANNVMGSANTVEGSNGVTIQGTGNKVTDAYKDMNIDAFEAYNIGKGDYSALAKKKSGAVAVIGGANNVSKQTDSTVIGYDNRLIGGAENISHDVFMAGSHNKLNNVSDSIVMGNENAITGVSNVISFGHDNKIKASNAVAIGNGAGVSEEGGVALGVGSVADRAAEVVGYGAAEGETGIAWKATNGAVSVGSSVEGKKITRQITNVAAGTADTDAVNVAQLKKVSEAAASASQGWKLKTQKGNASDVKPGDTVEFDGDANIQVGNDGNKVSVTLKNQLTGMQSINGAGGTINLAGSAITVNKTTFNKDGRIQNVANGTETKDAVNFGQLQETNNKVDNLTTEVGKGWTVATENGTATKVGAGDTVKFIGDDNIVVSNTGKNVVVKLGKELTGLTSVTTNNAYVTKVDASKNESVTNVEYVKNQIADAALSAGKGISITDKKINVKLKDGEENLVVNQDGLSLNTTLNGMEAINGVGGGKISFSGGNVTINNNVTFNKDGRIQNVTAGTENTDAVNYGQLKDYVAANDTHIKGGYYAVGEVTDNAGNKSQGVSMHIVNKEGNVTGTVTITDVAKASDVGNVTNINNDLKNPNGTTTVVDAVNNLNQKLDKKVGDLNYVEGGAETKGNYVTNGESTTVSIGKLDQALKDVADTAAKHTTVSGSSNIVVEPPTTNTDGGKNYNVKLADEITVNSVTANTFTAGQTVVMNKGGLKVGDKVSVSATAVTAGKTSISDEGVKVGDKTYISADGLNANGQHITNVKAGEADTDAVNYGQLKNTNQRIDGVENQVISNSNRINQLGNRVNKVGAGAAALAALHPMDFDPDDKLTFSAGYGNYGGENAAAIGAYYRPDEKVMFSVGGTVGNGENMVNAGVSFALDRTNHVSNSRTALAREVIDLRGQLAVMGAKMAKMEKALGMLDETKTKLFPDIPANHWAYEYIAKLAGNGYIEGYPDGNFGGDRLMTRYEFAAMLYRAIEKGAALEEKIIKEFEPELGRIRVDRISGEDGDRDKIERVRVNDTKGERDHYGNKLAK